jgi:3-deoxy-manno-octulosonate cytidylyltransferase (CMP-KDO synthetase)
MNVLVIPARWGSTRFPGKPLAEIGGEPMVVRVWKRVRQCAGFDDVFVATDSEEIAGCCEAFGIDWVMTGKDCRNGTERCAEFAEGMQDGDLIVNVQGDEPLMEPAIPQRVLFNLQNKPDRVWTAVRDIREEEKDNNDVVKCWVENGEIRSFSRMYWSGQDHVHIGVYGYTVKKLREYVSKNPTGDEVWIGLEQLRWGEPLACVTVEYDGIGVDRPSDIQRVEGRISAESVVV